MAIPVPTPNPALVGLQSAIRKTLMQGKSDPDLAQAIAVAPPPSPFGGPGTPSK